MFAEDKVRNYEYEGNKKIEGECLKIKEDLLDQLENKDLTYVNPMLADEYQSFLVLFSDLFLKLLEKISV